MNSRFPRRWHGMAWVITLIVMAFAIAACGGEATSDGEEAAATEEVAAEATSEEAAADAEEEAPAEEETAEEDSVVEEEEQAATENENLLNPSVAPQDVVCQGVEVPARGIEPVTEDDWAQGPADAPVTMVEYGDFQ